MRALRVVGLEDDGKTVILEDATRGERFALPADERLRAAARGDAARLSQMDSELETQMRPREIQARIRAGESVEQVAAASGLPEQKVERFAYPVLLERSRTAELAQLAHPVREDGPDVQTLGEVLAHTFTQRSQDYSAAVWDSWRGDDNKWVVELSWTAGHSDNAAHWVFHPGAHGGTVTAVNEHAIDLLDPNPNRQLRTVRPVTELAQQALQVQQPHAQEARRVVGDEPRADRPAEALTQPPAHQAPPSYQAPHQAATPPHQALAPPPVEHRTEPTPVAPAATEPTHPAQPEPEHVEPARVEPEPAAHTSAPVTPDADLDYFEDFELADEPAPTPQPEPEPVATITEPDAETDTETVSDVVTDTVTVADTAPSTATPETATANTEAVTDTAPTAPTEAPADTTEIPADTTEISDTVTVTEPAAPAETVKPAEPVEPEAPAETAEPTTPAESTTPTTPAEPTAPAEPTTPAAPADTAEPAEPAAKQDDQDGTPMEAPAKQDPPAAPRRAKSKKGRPIVPSWEDVLLGTRSNRG